MTQTRRSFQGVHPRCLGDERRLARRAAHARELKDSSSRWARDGAGARQHRAVSIAAVTYNPRQQPGHRERWPAGSSTRPAARYKTSTRHGRASAPFVSSAILSILPGVISLIAYADCPVARECLIPQEEFHFVGVVSTRGPLDHNISPQTTCVFVRPLCYARTPRKRNIIVFTYKTN